jgi:diguanylate cyclase (GGDEF)-like protein/PAS domain S-box-containing protein
MLRVYDVIAHQHDPRLEILSVLIAVFGALTTVRLLTHAAACPPAGRRLWVGAAAVAAGAAIWATHFLDLLSFRTAGPIAYGLLPAALALAAAVAVTGAGLALSLYRPGRWVRAAGGALLGVAIGIGHYLGMVAATLPGFLTWNLTTVAASILVGCTLCAAATVVALGQTKSWGAPMATACFALAIGVVHVAGIAAATFHPTGLAIVQPDSISSAILAANVAFVCCVIMLLSLAALDVDRRSALRRAAERATLRSLADVAVEGLAVCDGARVVAVNRSLELMSGWAAGELQGRDIDTLFHPAPTSPGMAMLLEKAGERVLVAKSGEQVPVEVMRKPITYEGRPHEVVALRDLRERRRAEEEIRFLAHHDALTGLCNRPAFALGLDRQLEEQAREHLPFALLGVDLDRFKAVNDTLGHPLGDVLLKRVAQRLRSAVRESDLVGRIGGDEFCILLAAPVTPDDAAALAHRVVEMLRRPFIVDSEVVSIGASVGVAMAPRDGGDAVELMKHADLALYRAKKDGGNAVRFFEPGADRAVHERRLLEMQLRRALRQDELDAHYQPLFDLRTQTVHGFEALARWRHPERGLLLPGEFIALAEETGLIVPLGARILALAAAQAVAWGEEVSVAVNLSAMQFADGKLVETVRATLAQTGLDPHRLELEITESVLLRESAATLATLHDLRALGVRISMDDFGTGYSSLRYLRSFPFDKIKIDQSFVHEMLSNAECATIIDAVIGIGRRLGITTTAEGVETAAQMARLQEAGCDMVQGYLIGRPEPAAAAVRHLGRAAQTTTKREFHRDANAQESHA